MEKKLYFKEEQSLVGIGNNLLEIFFDVKNSFSIMSLKDLKNDYEFICNHNVEKMLFMIALSDIESNDVFWYGNNDFKKCFYNLDKNIDNYKIIFNFEQIKNWDIKVQIEVSIKYNSNKILWHFNIKNNSNISVFNLTCPILAGLFRLGDPVDGESIATGRQGEGYLFEYPFRVKDNLPLKMGKHPGDTAVGIGKYHGMYPGAQQMQFLLYYNNFSGLYIGTHDKDMNFKSFDIDEIPDWKQHPSFQYSNYRNEDLPSYSIEELEKLNKIPVISISHFPGEKPNKDISIEYDTVLAVFCGDWFDGAEIYKEWALKQNWCKEKLIDRCNNFVKNGFSMFLFSNFNSYEINKREHSLTKISNFINNISKKIGKNVICAVFNWEGEGAWASPKGLFPPREGNIKFKKFVSSLNSNGNILSVSLPIDEWYIKIPYYPKNESFDCTNDFKREAAKYAICHRDGIYIRSLFDGWEQSQICAGTDYFSNFVFDIYRKCINNGISAIWIGGWPDAGDNANCYERKHLHELGYGNWWAKKYREVLKKVNVYSREIEPNFLNIGEGICDCFLDLLDMYDHRAGMWEVFSHLEDDFPCGAKTIPLFNYIYNEYIGSFSAPWPEINRPEVQYWIRCMGKSLVQGAVPMGSLHYKNPFGINNNLYHFYLTINKAASNECWKYIMFGKMLRPLKFENPLEKILYLRTKGNQMDNSKIYETKDFAIEHSAWQAQDGDIGYIFVNITKKIINLEIEFPNLNNNKSYRINHYINSKLILEENNIELPLSKNLHLSPLSVLLIEIKNN